MRRVIVCLLASGTLLVFGGCGGTGSTSSTVGATTTAGQGAVTSTTATAATAATASTKPTTPAATGAAAPEPKLHSPEDGSPESKAILDGLRVPVQQKLDQPVLFVVHGITVQDGFAFVVGRPVQPSGAAIDYSRTPYKAQVEADAFDDAIYALLRWNDGSWEVLTYNIGATDVAWAPWAAEFGAPEAVFPSLGN